MSKTQEIEPKLEQEYTTKRTDILEMLEIEES